jgi:hypothetical protein
MKLIVLALCAASVACGGSESPASPDAGNDGGGFVRRGVQGTGPADAGGIWALGLSCSATNFSQCPFPEMQGTCYKSTASPQAFCGVPGQVSSDGLSWVCPAGTDAGTAVGVPMCVKLAAGAADCPPFTNYLNGFCVYF